MDLSLNNQLTMEFMSSIISANMYTDCRTLNVHWHTGTGISGRLRCGTF